MTQKKSYTVQEALKSLMQYCAYQDRCHKEVEQKLRDMNMIPAAQEKIIIKLIAENFLNEERFAQSFARGKFRIKKWGKVRIVRELKLRDISAYNIKTALKEIEEPVYLKTFHELASKKAAQIKEPNIFKKKKKIADHLLLKGYEPQLVYDFLANFEQ